jgi:hypothetical protein
MIVIKMEEMIDTKLDGEKKFLLGIFAVSFFIRLVLSPFFMRPHDMIYYINNAENVISGSLYVDTSTLVGGPTYVGPYGPLQGLIYTPIILLFGKNYWLLKMPSIFFDSLNVLLVYLIARNLKNAEVAKYISVFYGFSYLVIFSAAAQGKNDNYQLFFALMAIYFLVKKSPSIILSAVFLGIGAGFIFIPLTILPAILYYLYQVGKIKEIIIYPIVTFATLGLILLPFSIVAGWLVLHPYIGPWVQIPGWPPSITHPVDGMGIPNMIKMLSYFFIYGSDKPYDTYVFPDRVATISVLLGLVFILIYAFRFKMSDRKIELIRNIFLIFFLGFVFFREFFFLNIPWIFPLVLILGIVNLEKRQFSLGRPEILGILVTILSLGLHTIVYRDYFPYSPIEKVAISLGILLAAIGTYFTMQQADIKSSWSFVMLAGVAFNVMDARILTLFSGIFPILAQSRFSWGFYYFGVTVLMLAAMIFLFKDLHKLNRQNYE